MSEDLKNQLHRVTIGVRAKINPFDCIETLSWDGLTNELMFKYKWYFDYRHALLKVKYPRKTVDFIHYRYTPETTTELERAETRKKNMIAAKRRKITEIENRIREEQQKWSELFPLADHVNYKKAVEKMNRLKFEINSLQQ